MWSVSVDAETEAFPQGLAGYSSICSSGPSDRHRAGRGTSVSPLAARHLLRLERPGPGCKIPIVSMEAVRASQYFHSEGVDRMSQKVVVASLVATAGVLLIVLVVKPFDVYRRTPAEVETFLRQQTPIGTPQAQVLTWLRERDIDPEVHESTVEPGSDYPPTEVGGSSFVQESVGHYRTPFRTDVEAFYIFDNKGRLADLRVRKSTDGP
jgi:hypothetical protein